MEINAHLEKFNLTNFDSEQLIPKNADICDIVALNTEGHPITVCICAQCESLF